MEKQVKYILKNNGKIEITPVKVKNNKTNIKQEQFLSPNEIAIDIIKNRLKKESIDYLKISTRSDLLSQHFSFGMWIRNTYALWDHNNPYTDFSNPNGYNHPDNLSFTIMLKVRTLLVEDINLDKEINSNIFETFDNSMKFLGE